MPLPSQLEFADKRVFRGHIIRFLNQLENAVLNGTNDTGQGGDQTSADLAGYLVASNNLSDVDNVDQARLNLGIEDMRHYLVAPSAGVTHGSGSQTTDPVGIFGSYDPHSTVSGNLWTAPASGNVVFINQSAMSITAGAAAGICRTYASFYQTGTTAINDGAVARWQTPSATLTSGITVAAMKFAQVAVGDTWKLHYFSQGIPTQASWGSSAAGAAILVVYLSE